MQLNKELRDIINKYRPNFETQRDGLPPLGPVLPTDMATAPSHDATNSPPPGNGSAPPNDRAPPTEPGTGVGLSVEGPALVSPPGLNESGLLSPALSSSVLLLPVHGSGTAPGGGPIRAVLMESGEGSGTVTLDDHEANSSEEDSRCEEDDDF